MTSQQTDKCQQQEKTKQTNKKRQLKNEKIRDNIKVTFLELQIGTFAMIFSCWTLEGFYLALYPSYGSGATGQKTENQRQQQKVTAAVEKRKRGVPKMCGHNPAVKY